MYAAIPQANVDRRGRESRPHKQQQAQCRIRGKRGAGHGRGGAHFWLVGIIPGSEGFVRQDPIVCFNLGSKFSGPL
jgi:hypothetical protein